MKKLPLLLLGAALAMAEETATLEPIQVTANNFEQDIYSTTDSIQIITAEDIDKYAAESIDELLSRLANITTSRSGGLGQPTSIFLRGFSSKYTLVLIDGVRVNDFTTPSITASYEHLHLDDIERIEIIKGAQSGIWGSDASAGVINIITKKAKNGLHAYAKVSYGSFNTTRTAFGASYKTDDFNIKLNANLVGSDGYSAAEPSLENNGTTAEEAGFEKDKYENRTYTSQFGWNMTSKDRLQLDLKSIRAYTEYDAWNGDSSIYYNNTQQDYYQLNYAHKGTFNFIDIKAAYSDYIRDQNNGYSANFTEYEIKDLWKYAETANLQVGANYQTRFEHKSGGIIMDKALDNGALFLSNVNQINNWTFTQSLRYDNYEQFNNVLTGKIGLKYTMGDAFVLLNSGTGYNVPTLEQLYGAWGANSNLTPESIVSSTIETGHKGVKIAYFYNEITNMIVYTSAYENSTGASVLQGIELSYQKFFNPYFDIATAYTFIDARDQDGNFLARRPKHQATLSISSNWTDAITTLLNFEYVGTRYESLGETGAQTGEYLLTNISANYTFDDYKVFFAVNNLFNINYQIVDGYQTPGINGKVGFSANF